MLISARWLPKINSFCYIICFLLYNIPQLKHKEDYKTVLIKRSISVSFLRRTSETSWHKRALKYLMTETCFGCENNSHSLLNPLFYN